MKIDLDDLKLLKEAFAPAQPRVDKDSFTSFTGGLRENWIFIIALVALSMWLLNNFNDIAKANQIQTLQIAEITKSKAQNEAEILKNAQDIRTLDSSQVTSINDIIRKLDSLQASMDALKGQNK